MSKNSKPTTNVFRIKFESRVALLDYLRSLTKKKK
jgi:hypothetical protein